MMHTLMERIGAAGRGAVLAAGLVAVVAPNGAAQSVGPRWQAWLGCWTAAPAVDQLVPTTASAPLVCVTPTSDANVVAVTTIAAGKTVSTQRIDASGREEPVTAKGCSGTQRARWSADGRRVYLDAVATCDGVRRTTSGILALTAQGEWLDVKGVKAGDGTTVAVTRYRDAGLPGGLPSEISGALADRGMSSQGARVAAGADVGTAAVTEASKVASDAVVEAWLLERGQAFALSGRELVALADAGVPARVTDAMVAVSNPKAFSVARQDPRDRVGAGDDEVVGRRISVYLDPRGGPWSWGYSPYGYSPYGYSPYGYSPYGYSPYAYSPYGYYSPYGGYGAYAPVIVVNRPDAATAHGKLVKGRGYTRDEPAGSAASSTRAPAERPASSAGSSGSTRSDGSASSGSQSTGRTAKPRP